MTFLCLVLAIVLAALTVCSDLADGLGKSMRTRVLFLFAIMAALAAIISAMR